EWSGGWRERGTGLWGSSLPPRSDARRSRTSLSRKAAQTPGSLYQGSRCDVRRSGRSVTDPNLHSLQSGFPPNTTESVVFGAKTLTEYRGTEGTRPYAGAGWYYAEYRWRVSPEFMALLAVRLGWRRADRVLDLGAGPAQLSFLAAPFVAEVVAVEPEPDM